MTHKSESGKYTTGIIIIHWLTTILILALFPMGKFMEGLPISEKMGLVKVHVILGNLIFLLTLVRIYYFFKSPRPKAVETGSKINNKLIHWIHNGFYILLVAISVSGIASIILGGYGEAFNSGDISSIKPHSEIPPLKAHGFIALLIMVLLVFHVVGVVKHYIIKKENTLKRVWW